MDGLRLDNKAVALAGGYSGPSAAGKVCYGSQRVAQRVRIAFCVLVTLLPVTEGWPQLEKWEVAGVWVVPPVALDRSPAVARIRSRLAAHQVSKARQLAALLMRKEPQSQEGYFWVGFIELVEGHLYRAVKHLRQAEKLQPPGNAIQKVLGLAYCRLKQRLLCEVKIREAMALDPTDFAPHYLLGHYMQSEKQDPVSAVEHYRHALERRPNHYPVLYHVGTAYEETRKLAEAKTYFEQAIAIAEREGRTFSLPYQALSRLNRGNVPEASLKFATRAVALEPKRQSNHLELAKVYRMLERLVEAVNAVKTAIALDPAQSSPYYQLFGLYRRLGEREAAEQALAEFQRRRACYGTK